MARVKIDSLEKYLFKFEISVRVTDLNYGNHLSNDKLMVFAHEARMAWLSSLEQSELDFFGVSFIQGDVACVYNSEGFYGNQIDIQLGITDISNSSFDIVYEMYNVTTEKSLAILKTRMVCFDYEDRKVQSVPERFRAYLNS